MTKHILLFAATFLLGALIALAARTALHDPHAVPTAPVPATHTSHDHHAAATTPAEPKTQNPEPKTTAASVSSPVNSVCAICGMKVDPSLPTLEYKGQRIAFGCRMCPPKFKANPDKYGPYYLRNEVMPK